MRSQKEKEAGSRETADAEDSFSQEFEAGLFSWPPDAGRLGHTHTHTQTHTHTHAHMRRQALSLSPCLHAHTCRGLKDTGG